MRNGFNHSDFEVASSVAKDLFSLHSNKEAVVEHPTFEQFAGSRALLSRHVKIALPWYLAESGTNEDQWHLEDDDKSICSIVSATIGVEYKRLKGSFESLANENVIEVAWSGDDKNQFMSNVRLTEKGNQLVKEREESGRPIFANAQNSVLRYLRQTAYLVWDELNVELNFLGYDKCSGIKDMQDMNVRDVENYIEELRKSQTLLMKIIDSSVEG